MTDFLEICFKVKNKMYFETIIKSNLKFFTLQTFLKRILVPMAMLIISGCQQEGQQKIPIDLLERIDQYYTMEKNNQWELAYALRSKEFRNTFDKLYYVSEMKKASNGWQLIKYDILKFSIDKDRVILTITFHDKPPESFRKEHNFYNDLSEISFEDKSVWEKDKGIWYCVSAGRRHHLVLNGSVN